MDIFGTEVPMPSLGIGAGGSNLVVILLTVFIFFLAVALIIWLIYMKKIYNRRIIVFENISGQGFQKVLRDSARLIRIGDGGEELMWLRKKKLYRTAYGRKMGKNEYWFAIGQDGYWYNCVLGDLDAKMGMLDIEPIDRDMRYMHVAVRKNITERYRKLTFMEKHGVQVMGLIFLLIFGGLTWINMDKMAETAAIINDGVETTKEVAELNRDLLVLMENTCTGGTGLIPVGGGG